MTQTNKYLACGTERKWMMPPYTRLYKEPPAVFSERFHADYSLWVRGIDLKNLK